MLMLLGMGVHCFCSCADTYDGDDTWTSSVRNQQLLSPAAETITITPSTDGSQQTIAWKVVYGAGKYELKLHNLTTQTMRCDTIDGCSLTTAREEDTNYQIELRTLGNAGLGNKEAAAATVKDFNTFTEAFRKIPAGDLYEYFQNNEIPDTVATSAELNFDLEPGGQYTLSKSLDFMFHKVVLRTTDKANRATITLADSANFIVSNDFTLKYVNVDASVCVKPVMECFKYSEEPDPSIIAKPKNYLLIDFVRLQDCNFKGVMGNLFFDSNLSWAVVNFLIKNCIIQMCTTTANIRNEAFISFQGGGVKDFTMTNSTVYQTGEGNSKYFLRYHNSVRVDRLGFDNTDHTSLTYINNTFYKVASGQWANYSGIQNFSAYTVLNNIWVDCADGQIARRMMGNSRMGNSCTANWNNNTYWINGEAKDNSQWDTGFILTTDPALTDPDNPVNPLFTPKGAEQVERQTGDPRWWLLQ